MCRRPDAFPYQLTLTVRWNEDKMSVLLSFIPFLDDVTSDGFKPFVPFWLHIMYSHTQCKQQIDVLWFVRYRKRFEIRALEISIKKWIVTGIFAGRLCTPGLTAWMREMPVYEFLNLILLARIMAISSSGIMRNVSLLSCSTSTGLLYSVKQ